MSQESDGVPFSVYQEICGADILNYGCYSTLITWLRWCLPGLSTEKLLWEIPGGSIKFHFASNFHPLILISIDNTATIISTCQMFQKFLYVNLNFYCNKQCPHFPIFKYLFTTIWTVDIYLILVYNPLSLFILFFKLSPDLVTGSSFMLAPHFFFEAFHYFLVPHDISDSCEFFLFLSHFSRSSGSFLFQTGI